MSGKATGRTFPGVRHTGGKKGLKKPSQLLKDLRHVYKEADPGQDTEAQRRLRKLADENYDKFLAMLQRAEQSHAAGAGKGAGGAAGDLEKPKPPEGADEGADRAEELIDRLLTDFEQGGER